MWSVIFSRFFSWNQCTGRELRHRTTITSVYLMLMLPIVVGGDGDVAAYQYIVESETFTLHNMKHSSLTSSSGFHSLTFTLSGIIQQRHWIYLVPTLELTSTYSLLRINSIISSIRQRPSSTYRIFALNCVKSECAWHASFS